VTTYTNLPRLVWARSEVFHGPKPHEDGSLPAVITKARKKPVAGLGRTPELPADYMTIEAAAERMDMTPDALRKRCRRGRRVGREVHLGGGIVAVKLARSWRVKFPKEQKG
jgi:hypothetical protein